MVNRKWFSLRCASSHTLIRSSILSIASNAFIVNPINSCQSFLSSFLTVSQKSPKPAVKCHLRECSRSAAGNVSSVGSSTRVGSQTTRPASGCARMKSSPWRCSVSQQPSARGADRLAACDRDPSRSLENSSVLLISQWSLPVICLEGL